MSDRPRLVVVGLGPGSDELITAGTLEQIAAHPVRFLRTTRHPAAAAAQAATSFDHLYDAADTLEQVYAGIVEHLVAAAVESGEVLYAVPGSPAVAERTVELLLADERVDVEVHPALSFLDLAWARLGIDPIARGVRVVDGQRFAVEAAGERGPLLVAQCDSLDVLSEIKLALDAGIDPCLGPDATITVLQRLGLPDEEVREVPWADLDREVEPDHLTSIMVPTLAVPVAREVERFAELVAVLRRECPWDREQTHQSLTRHLLEEAYEVLDAIDHLDADAGTGFEHLEEELGDLLFQVVFHATLAQEEGRFTLADVATGIHDKLRLRHPHVFGEVEVDGADDVVRNWEQIKKAEKGRTSVFDGIPANLPALAYTWKVQKKAASLHGVELPEVVGDDLGVELFDLVDRARSAGVDPEVALRSATNRYRDAVREREQGAAPS